MFLVDVQRFQLLPVLILAGREIFITFYRLQVARQGLAIPARKSAKWKTTVQGLALMIAVMPPLEESQWAVDFGIWVAAVFTVVTGFNICETAFLRLVVQVNKFLRAL